MANFTNIQITNQGRALQAKAQAGAALNFTRFRIGSGSMSGQQIADMAGLIQPVMWLTLNKSQAHSAGRHTLGAPFTNSGISTGFYFREWGVFAQDPDVGEIMYCYGNVGSGAEYIPAGGGSEIIEQQLDMITLIGNAANVSAVIDESLMFATISQLNAHKQTTVLDHPDGSVTAAKLANNAATDTKIGNRTITDTVEPTGNTGTLTNLLSWLGNMIKAITGKASWRTAPAITLEKANDEIAALKTATAEGQTIPAPIQRGINVIQSDQASGATFNVRGCTLCNLLGRRGNGASATPFTLSSAGLTVDTTTYLTGDSSLRMVNSVGADGFAWINNPPVDPTKYYIAVARVKNGNLTRGIRLRWYNATAAASTASGSWYAGTDWHTIYIKMQPSNMGDQNYLMIDTGGAKDQYAHIDSLALFEISAVDYPAIDTSIVGGRAVGNRWPYVDSVQHTRGLSVLMPGKNLLPPFTQWTLHSTATSTVIEPYKLQFQPTASSQRSYTNPIAVVPGQQYTLSQKGSSSQFYFIIFDSVLGGAIVNTTNGVTSRTFTAPASGKIVIATTNAATTGTWIFEEPQLELGATSSAFEAYNPSYAHADTVLASNVDRSIADSYDSATGQVLRRWRTGFKLDGSLPWAFGIDQTGFKTIISNGWVATNGALAAVTAQSAVRHDGAIIKASSYAELSTIFEAINIGSTALHLNVSDAYSGWTDSLNPNGNAAKALMNGWKANGNNGSVYNSWVSILTGAAPATNSEAYVAANKAPGWDAYATLDYVRATPITEQLTGGLGGLNVVKGGNTVELLEGVVVREKANPVLYSGMYYINNQTTIGGLNLSKLTKRADVILSVYKGADKDAAWTVTAHSNANGNVIAQIPVANYDPAAEYYVDYIVMDKHTYTANAVDATLVYRSTLGGAVAQATQDISMLKQHNGVQDFALDYIQAHVQNVQKTLDSDHEVYRIQGDVSGGVRYVKIAELTDSIGAAGNALTLLIEGVASVASNQPGVDLVQIGTRYPGTIPGGLEITSLTPPYKGSLSSYAEYGTVTNATTGRIELWMKRPAYCAATKITVGQRWSSSGVVIVAPSAPQSTAPDRFSPTNRTQGDAGTLEGKSASEFVGVIDYVRSPGYTGTAGRSSTDFLVDLNPAPTALVDGLAFSFKAKYASLADIGIDLNSFGSRALTTIDGAPIRENQIPGGSIVSVRYNSNTSTFILQGIGGSTPEGSSTTEYLIATTSQTTILSYTPKSSAKLKRVMVYFRVITAATNVAITLTHTDVTGAQTLTLVASQSYAVGSYAIPVTAVYSSGVMNMNVTVNAANRVYVTAEIAD